MDRICSVACARSVAWASSVAPRAELAACPPTMVGLMSCEASCIMAFSVSCGARSQLDHQSFHIPVNKCERYTERIVYSVAASPALLF